MQKTATVYDVAAHAGVSIATVSRVFRRPADVRASTRERVLASVRALGYLPSASARGLAARRTGVLGLYFPDFDAVEDADDDPIAGAADARNPIAGAADARDDTSADRPAAVEVVVDIPDSGAVRRPNL